jgi:hypothetical protein
MSDIIIATQHSTAGIVTRRVGYAVYSSVVECTHFTLRESVWNSVRFPVWTTIGTYANLSIEYSVEDYFKNEK